MSRPSLDRPAWSLAAGFLISLAAITVGFGYGPHMLQEAAKERLFLGCSLGLLLGITTLATVRRAPSSAFPDDAPWLLLLGFLAVAFYLSFSTTTAVGLTIAVMLAMIGGRWGAGGSGAFAVGVAALVTMMVIHVYWLTQNPGHQIAVDVMPITQEAIRQALAGTNPYQADYGAITPRPFFYLPLHWLAYLPSELLGFHPRWFNFLCWGAMILVFERGMLSDSHQATARGYFYPCIASFPVFQAMEVQVLPSWTVLLLFIYTLRKGRLGWAAFLLGCLLAMSQLMLAVGCLAAAHFIRLLPIQRFLWLAAIIVSVLIATLGPFVLLSPNFLMEVFVTRPAVANSFWDLDRNAFNAVGVNYLLFSLHLETTRSVLQVIVLLAGALDLLLRPARGTDIFLVRAGVTFMAAVALNGQIVGYYYYYPLLMIACGAGLRFAELTAERAEENDKHR